MFLKNSFKWLATFVLLISVFSVGAAHPVPATAAGPPDSSNVYWWWGDPAGSSIIVPSPCGEPDLFDPDVKPDVLYGAGNVVGGSENASFGYHRNAGDNSGSIADLFGMPTNNGEPWGLIDPQGAEVHYVVRSHGPKDPAEMPAQIDSFEGGCVTDYLPPADSLDLHLGAGDCQDIQFAINQP
jgi:hypothetical protein